jgi:hypothetical protein
MAKTKGDQAQKSSVLVMFDLFTEITRDWGSPNFWNSSKWGVLVYNINKSEGGGGVTADLIMLV